MRIGFDIDGVLSNFIKAYQALFVSVTGRDLFEPNDVLEPPCWDWPQLRGYTDEEVAKVWAIIKSDPEFWVRLDETEHMKSLRGVAETLLAHDVYFVTDRPGIRTKTQTEDWLLFKSGCFNPTVLVSAQKGLCAKALKLDCYIDDKLENVWDVQQATTPRDAAGNVIGPPATRTYLLDRGYNQHGLANCRRVKSLAEFLEAEGLA